MRCKTKVMKIIIFRSLDRTVYIEGVVVFCYATNFPTNANTLCACLQSCSYEN